MKSRLLGRRRDALEVGGIYAHSRVRMTDERQGRLWV